MRNTWLESPTTRYIASLDGLRALAVLAVVAVHVQVPIGGYHGVTVFFVVSGYLITTILTRELAISQQVHLMRFYGRRIGRLTPALVLVVLVTLAWTASQGELSDHLLGAASALLYLSDFTLPILGAETVTPLFTWSWSLAIEEHFYLLWPFALLLLVKTRTGVAVALLVLLIAGSWAVRAYLYVSSASHERIFYAFDTHVDALALGGLIAFAAKDLARWRPPLAWQLVIQMAALACLGAVMLRPGIINALIPLDAGGFGSVALLSAAVVASMVAWQGTIVSTVLAQRPLVHLGRLSYGLYLWNMLTIAIFTTTFGVSPLSTPLGVLWAVGLYLVSLCSYTLVEQPARRVIYRLIDRATPKGQIHNPGSRLTE